MERFSYRRCHSLKHCGADLYELVVVKGQRKLLAADVCYHHCHWLGGEGYFAFLCQPIYYRLVIGGEGVHVNAVFLAEVVGNGFVKVLTAQMIVACNGKYLHNAVKGIDYGDIKGASAEIHYHICAVPEAVACLIGKCCGGWLIYQPFNINAGKLCGKLGGGSAVIVKICGHADDSLGHRLAQIGFRIFLYPAQHKGGQLLGREAPSAESYGLAQTHYPLWHWGGI